MSDIYYIDRLTGQVEIEKVYKGKAVRLLYGDSLMSRLVGFFLIPLVARWSFFSALYGYIQKQPASVKRIRPFIQNFEVDSSEFLDSVESYRSFNDFFIRRLKPEARPLAPGREVAIIPADGRYYFYQNIDQCDGFIVKGKKFELGELVGDESLAEEYAEGSMMIARLCPSDYHRFHFPCDGVPGPAKLINGYLYSVNPLAIKKNLSIFTQNKRMVTELETEAFGKVLYLEIGATNVGTIRETYVPFAKQKKGDEKGYFEFGGSALILLFKNGTIQFDADLLNGTSRGIEVRCLMGQSLGKRN